MQRKHYLWFLIAPTVAFFCLFWLLPILQLFVIGARAPDKGKRKMAYFVALTSPQYLKSLWNTVWVSVLTSLLAIILAGTSAFS